MPIIAINNTVVPYWCFCDATPDRRLLRYQAIMPISPFIEVVIND